MPNQYTTVQGDTWDLIAHKTLGNEMYANKIIESNLKSRNIIIFSAGVVLTIPEIKIQSSTELPPWKRGSVTV